jgi:hypothetical protein
MIHQFEMMSSVDMLLFSTYTISCRIKFHDVTLNNANVAHASEVRTATISVLSYQEREVCNGKLSYRVSWKSVSV